MLARRSSRREKPLVQGKGCWGLARESVKWLFRGWENNLKGSTGLSGCAGSSMFHVLGG